MPGTLGSTTKSVWVATPEAHKLSVEFVVTAAVSVRQGDAVVLVAAGTVSPAGTAAAAYTVIGYALMDAAAGEFVTVAMRAFAIVNAEAAAASLAAGPVQLGAWNGTTLKREFAAAAGADDAAKTVVTVGHNLTQGTLDGDAIRVALLA